MKLRPPEPGILLLLCSALAPAAGAQPLVIVDSVCDIDLATCTAGPDGLRGARSASLSPDGRHLYVAAWTSQAP